MLNKIVHLFSPVRMDETLDKKALFMKKIALFNHKGGVGKSTLTINIANALAKMGKTVLLVDADPQCNLTSFYLGPVVN